MTWITAYNLLVIWRLLDSAVDMPIRIHHDNLHCGVNHCCTDQRTDCCVVNVEYESLLYCRRELSPWGHLLQEHKSIVCLLKIFCRRLDWLSNILSCKKIPAASNVFIAPWTCRVHALTSLLSTYIDIDRFYFEHK